MPILIRHQDKNTDMVQPLDSVIIKECVVLVSWRSYAALATAYRVLHGSI
jgi:hypothetical protein